MAEHEKVHKYDIPLAGSYFTRNLHPDGAWSRMVYRNGQPVAGSQTKAANTKAGVRWFTLIGYQRVENGEKKRVELQYGPFESSREADAILDVFGAGIVAVLTMLDEQLEHLPMVEHTGAPGKGAKPANVDAITGALDPEAPQVAPEPPPEAGQ